MSLSKQFRPRSVKSSRRRCSSAASSSPGRSRSNPMASSPNMKSNTMKKWVCSTLKCVCRFRKPPPPHISASHQLYQLVQFGCCCEWNSQDSASGFFVLSNCNNDWDTHKILIRLWSFSFTSTHVLAHTHTHIVSGCSRSRISSLLLLSHFTFHIDYSSSSQCFKSEHISFLQPGLMERISPSKSKAGEQSCDVSPAGHRLSHSLTNQSPVSRTVVELCPTVKVENWKQRQHP